MAHDTTASAKAEYKDYVLSLTNNKYDPQLGSKVHECLLELGLETPGTGVLESNPEKAFQHLAEGINQGMASLGLYMGDPSLIDTPRRFAAMFVGELTIGLNYNLFPKIKVTPNSMSYDEMVLVANIQTTSLCEHHLQTIDGVTHIAYIPDKKVMGLSKFARITEFFARRPQIQERMTEQIFASLGLILETHDIAVVQRATHYCMKARGALQHGSQTTTSKMGGRFLTNPALRQEFFHAIR